MKIQKINLLNPIKTPKFNGIEKNKKAEKLRFISLISNIHCSSHKITY